MTDHASIDSLYHRFAELLANNLRNAGYPTDPEAEDPGAQGHVGREHRAAGPH